MPADMNSHYEIRMIVVIVSCCFHDSVLQFSMSYVLGCPKPVAISGSTS